MPGIRLEFAQFGDFDSFDIHRSISTMSDLSNLPTPITTNLKKMFYVDFDVVQGTTYYYRVVAWRGGVKAISNEISIKAVNPYLIDIKIENGVLVDAGSLEFHWAETSVMKDDVNGILFGSYQSSLLADKVFNFNQNFKITFEFKRLSSIPKYSVFMAITSDAQWGGSLRRFAVGVGGVGGGDASIINKVFISRSRSGTANVTVSKTIDNNVWYTVEFSRNGDVFTLKVDDVVNTFTDTDATFNSIPMLIGTNLVNAADGQFNGYIRNFKAHDLNA